MRKYLFITLTILFVLAIGLSAHSKDTTISKDTLLYVQDHAGEHFLVLKVDQCDLGNRGEVTCVMKPDPKAKPITAGPKGSFWDRLSYPNG